MCGQTSLKASSRSRVRLGTIAAQNNSGGAGAGGGGEII